MTIKRIAKLPLSGGFVVIALAAFVASCAHAPPIGNQKKPSAEQLAQMQCAPVALPDSKLFSAEPFDNGLPISGQWRDGFDLADMNADGHLDLLHGPPRKGRTQPIIFLGNGNGQFKAWAETHFPPLPYDYGDIKSADFNGDGRADIALSSHLRGMVTLINEAGGHYAPWGEGLGLRAPGQFPDEALFSSRSIAVADWNGDGQPDLLALNEGPSRFASNVIVGDALALFLNRGGYWERMTQANPLRSFGDALAIGDINGDGQPDALIGTQVAGNRLLLQLGDKRSFVSTELHALPMSAAITAVALHDFDGDGRDEVVNATRAVERGAYCTGLQVVSIKADGSEQPTMLWREVSRDPVVAIDVADFNGDGIADVFALRQQGGMMFFAGSAKGFSRDLMLPTPTQMQSCQAFDAGIADLNGDGQAELIVSFAGDDPGTGAMPCDSGGGFASWHLRAASL